MSVFITSDLHFCHDRPFLYEPRGFKSISEMNAAIVRNWNEIVQPDDTVYVLGDLMLNNNVEGAALFASLKGHLHIILGNHDTDTRIDLYKRCYNVVEIGFASRLRVEKYHFFLTHYPTLCGNLDDGKTLGQHVINLCGHTHTKDKFVDWDKGIIYHCELDAHDNKPVAIETIIDDLRGKQSGVPL